MSIGSIDRSQQYVFDFTSRTNERCARLLQLRSVLTGMTAGRIGGVIELLQRLTVLASYLPESLAEDYSVDACVAGISARIKTRAPVAERTVRRWTESAKELGLLSVRYMSQEYGGHKWNCYNGPFLDRAGHGRFRADTGGHGRTKCPAFGADKMSGLKGGQNVRPS